jgi:hypothetical protein
MWVGRLVDQEKTFAEFGYSILSANQLSNFSGYPLVVALGAWVFRYCVGVVFSTFLKRWTKWAGSS